MLKKKSDKIENENKPKMTWYFEIGGLSGATTELIITAEGNSSAFDAVRTLVDAAPSLPGWELIAFKPAHGFAFVTEHGRARIDASGSWFMPLESKSAPTLSWRARGASDCSRPHQPAAFVGAGARGVVIAG